MVINSWSCLKIGPNGPSIIDPRIAQALQITACLMYRFERERMREFKFGRVGGVVTSEWRSYYIGPSARGVMFKASVVEVRHPYDVNFLLDLPELERIDTFMQKVGAYDGGWEEGLAMLPQQVWEAFEDFPRRDRMN